MKILLDNCVPRPFERLVLGHEVAHVSRLGWERLENGELLNAAEAEGFQVLVTVDQGIAHQQSMASRRISIVVIRSYQNDIHTLTPAAGAVMELLFDISEGRILWIDLHA